MSSLKCAHLLRFNEENARIHENEGAKKNVVCKEKEVAMSSFS